MLSDPSNLSPTNEKNVLVDKELMSSPKILDATVPGFISQTSICLSQAYEINFSAEQASQKKNL